MVTLITTDKIIAHGLPCPDSSGLTQPWATVIAAFLAIAAATIAYFGVRRTTDTAKKEARRKEKVDILIGAIDAIRSATRLLILLDRQSGTVARVEYTSANAVVHEDRQSACSLATAKLMLYGFDDITQAMSPHMIKLSDEWRAVVADPSHAVDIAGITDGLRNTLTAFETAFKALNVGT
jgi:hypothetical protein